MNIYRNRRQSKPNLSFQVATDCFMVQWSRVTSDCNPGWTLHGTTSTCYKYFKIGGIRWSEARAHCQMSGGDLASVPDKTTNDLLTRLSSEERAWIGGRKVEGSWTWSDGTPWQFESWAPGQPDNWKGSQNHAIINWSTYPGQWDDAHDKAHDLGFICQDKGETQFAEHKNYYL